MQTTRRPLPRIPPPHLTLARPAGIRSYRPLPTPPLRSTDSSCASSTETVYLQTPPSPHVTRDSSSSLSSINSFTSASSELLFKPRPRLRISVALATFRERSSLDSLTARTPALCDPGQILPPVAHCRNSATTTDPSCPKRTPRIPKRFSRVSAAGSDDSLLAFGCPAAAIGPDVFESEKDVSSIPQPKDGIFDRTATPQPARSQPTTILTDRIGIDHPVTAVRVVTDMISNFEVEGLTPRTVGSIDLTNDRKSRVSNRRNWKSFSNIVKVAMKSHLFRPKIRSPRSSDAPVADAKRVSQLAAPLNQAWYKELDGWMWVEKDVGEVLTELRKPR